MHVPMGHISRNKITFRQRTLQVKYNNKFLHVAGKISNSNTATITPITVI
jgi:hypothetical protein